MIVGNGAPGHVGAYLSRAASALGVDAELCDTGRAFHAPLPLRKLAWWVAGHRPVRLRRFGRYVVEICRSRRPSAVLATGLAPLDREALGEIGRLGVRRLNFLTDDPWNPAHRAAWFLRALDHYDVVFSPRRANLGDLREAGCRDVAYVPFAFESESHFPQESEVYRADRGRTCDVVYAGAADRDRLPYLTAIIRAGYTLALYGGFWDRFRETRRHTRGLADLATLRGAVADAKVALCLVRRANRDGHAMRSFELPALGACILAEDTADHRELYGPEGEAACYFRDPDEMIAKLRSLVADPTLRRRLALEVRRRVATEANTYRQRLRVMLRLPGSPSLGAAPDVAPGS